MSVYGHLSKDIWTLIINFLDEKYWIDLKCLNRNFQQMFNANLFIKKLGFKELCLGAHIESLLFFIRDVRYFSRDSGLKYDYRLQVAIFMVRKLREQNELLIKDKNKLEEKYNSLVELENEWDVIYCQNCEKWVSKEYAISCWNVCTSLCWDCLNNSVTKRFTGRTGGEFYCNKCPDFDEMLREYPDQWNISKFGIF